MFCLKYTFHIVKNGFVVLFDSNVTIRKNPHTLCCYANSSWILEYQIDSLIADKKKRIFKYFNYAQKTDCISQDILLCFVYFSLIRCLYFLCVLCLLLFALMSFLNKLRFKYNTSNGKANIYTERYTQQKIHRNFSIFYSFIASIVFTFNFSWFFYIILPDAYKLLSFALHAFESVCMFFFSQSFFHSFTSFTPIFHTLSLRFLLFL